MSFSFIVKHKSTGLIKKQQKRNSFITYLLLEHFHAQLSGFFRVFVPDCLFQVTWSGLIGTLLGAFCWHQRSFYALTGFIHWTQWCLLIFGHFVVQSRSWVGYGWAWVWVRVGPITYFECKWVFWSLRCYRGFFFGCLAFGFLNKFHSELF